MSDTPNDADHGLEGTLLPPGATPTVAGAARAFDGLPKIAGFTPIRKLGEGGMGSVFLAEDPKLGRRVAIKTMHPGLAANPADRDRFLREARAAAAVENDHLVPIWAVGEAEDGTPFIAMPLLQGESLADRLKREPVAPLELILKVADDVAAGLAAAHAKGLIHRDIKPPNIWLEGDPGSKRPEERVRRCKILDFGLARPVDGGTEPITASGAILGTPAFMAPEQARGEHVDARADLFSLGVTLYRMAAGRPPFDGPTPMAVLIALTTDTPPKARMAAPALPPNVADLIDRLMAKDRGGRPSSAADVSAAVRGIGGQPISKRSRTPLVLAAVGLLAVLGVGLWLATRGNQSPVEAVHKNDPPPEQPKKDEPLPKTEPPKKVTPPQPAGQDDRAAALFVLGLKGSVYVNNNPEEIRDAAKLPKEPFTLAQVYLTEPVKDSALAAFDGCKDITLAYLVGTQISNAGLMHLANCTNLASLDLAGTKVDDDAAPIIARFKKLKDLSIDSTSITPKGAREIAKALPLCRIQYGATFEPATEDDRLAAEFVLASGGRLGANYSDTELKSIPKELFRLTSVDLAGSTAATDAELDRFKNCKSLERLNLSGTPVGDPGLAAITEFTKIVRLDLRKTKVTEKAAAALAGSLPECEIVCDGRTFRPKK
jgi:serine/threonine protein kinase